MAQQDIRQAAYVIKAAELPALNFMDDAYPRPLQLEWINRGTDQELRPTTIAMLMRTLFRGNCSPSVEKLHDSSGLRAVFRSDRHRDQFAKYFSEACQKEHAARSTLITAVFDRPDDAEELVVELVANGAQKDAISLLWRTGEFLDGKHVGQQGHSKLSIAAVTAGGGLAGSLLGISILAIPGFGAVAAAGAIVASASGSVATVSGIIGATGAAVAKMLTDHDVDGRDATIYGEEVKNGKVFVAVDMGRCNLGTDDVKSLMKRHNGLFANEA